MQAVVALASRSMLVDTVGQRVRSSVTTSVVAVTSEVLVAVMVKVALVALLLRPPESGFCVTKVFVHRVVRREAKLSQLVSDAPSILVVAVENLPSAVILMVVWSI